MIMDIKPKDGFKPYFTKTENGEFETTISKSIGEQYRFREFVYGPDEESDHMLIGDHLKVVNHKDGSISIDVNNFYSSCGFIYVIWGVLW